MTTKQISNMVAAFMKQQKLETVDDLINLMNDLRIVRRQIVKNIIDNVNLDPSFGLLLKSAEKLLKSCLCQADAFDCVLKCDSTTLKGNIKDECENICKDLDYLDVCKNFKNDETQFVQRLATYHPFGVEKFNLETDSLVKLLRSAMQNSRNNISGSTQNLPYLDYFFTDWDGTFKTYCSNYTTSMQPAYSGIVLTKFASKFVKFTAVLTAGPLSNTGLLDLITIPPDLVNFGGSWGREWFLNKGLLNNGESTLVDKSCFTPENESLFKQLVESVKDLLKNDKFAQFKRIGSGFQRKVDRITLGVQTVTGDVPKERANEFLEALKKVLQKLDPQGDVFHFDKGELDVEVSVKLDRHTTPWSKGDGIKFIKERLKLDFNETSSVVVCGDTVGDVSMVEYFLSINVNVLAVFVKPSSNVQEKLEKLLSSKTGSTLLVVGCPEVIHSAMLLTLKGANC